MTTTDIDREFVRLLHRLYGPLPDEELVLLASQSAPHEPTVMRAEKIRMMPDGTPIVLHGLPGGGRCWTRIKAEWPTRCPCGRVIWC